MIRVILLAIAVISTTNETAATIAPVVKTTVLIATVEPIKALVATR